MNQENGCQVVTWNVVWSKGKVRKKASSQTLANPCFEGMRTVIPLHGLLHGVGGIGDLCVCVSVCVSWQRRDERGKEPSHGWSGWTLHGLGRTVISGWPLGDNHRVEVQIPGDQNLRACFSTCSPNLVVCRWTHMLMCLFSCVLGPKVPNISKPWSYR